MSSLATNSKNKKELPDEADVVVVGGGSIGSSILYHLQERGIQSVLLERHDLTAGTTWHSAGMLWRLRPAYPDIEMHTYSLQMCHQLEQETGITSWTPNGGLFISTTAERQAEYERLAETGKYYDIESHVLTPQEILQVHPLLNVEDVYGGLYSPTDGTMDPSNIVAAYARAAKSRGAGVFEKSGVQDIVLDDRGRVEAVVTDSGHAIRTRMVVNATGAWANGLAAMVGQKLPLLAMKHAFCVTEAIEGMHGNLPNVRDHDLSIYLKAQGNAMAIGGYEQNPEFWDTVSPEFAFGLFDLDWDTFEQNLNGHLQRCPAIETVGIMSTVAGPESFTPDHKPLVGFQPGVRGFFNACGFNSMGMMLGGGIGREVATWIDQGSPELDLFGFDCSRFHPETVQDDVWVKDRTHESYAKTYAIVFPHDENLAGRNARQSALHEELVKRGCVHQARHGYERPGWFAIGETGDQVPKPYDYYGAYAEGAWRLAPSLRDTAEEPADISAHEEHKYLDLVESELTFGWPTNFDAVGEECYAARNGVAIFDQSYFGKFFLRGPDAHQAVQYICGADMEKQVPGSVTYTPLCNVRGGVEADLTVTRLPDDSGYYFAAGGNTVTKDFEWISRQLEDNGFSSTLTDASQDLCMLSVQGPHSRALLSPLVTEGSLEEVDIPFSTCHHITIAGIPVYCLRLTFVGELGFELHIPSEHAAHVYRAVREAGDAYAAKHNVPVRDGGYRAIDSLSAEMNFRHWHADLTNSDTPLESGIGFTVLGKLKREDKPDFVGRAALEEHRARGLQKKLVCLTIPRPENPLFGNETIWRNGECLGLVRSTAYGYTIGQQIAYGYVKAPEGVKKITKKWLEEGVWEIGDKGVNIPATFHNGKPYTAEPVVLEVAV